MEDYFCAVAAAAFMITVLWTLKQSCDAGYWSAAFGALGVSLYFTVPAVCCGAAFLCCSLALLCVTARRDELLPLKDRAVLITGETHLVIQDVSSDLWSKHQTSQQLLNYLNLTLTYSSYCDSLLWLWFHYT